MNVGDAPLLSVRNLHTYFAQDEGMVKAVDGVSLEMSAGATLGVVGESGCGKSVTARSILRIVDRPGRIVAGEIWFRRPTANGGAGSPAVDLAKLEPNSKEMRSIRGAEIALIFQEPMSSFSPVHTVGNQIIEAIMLHQEIGRREARDRAIEMLRRVGVSLPGQRVDQLANQLSGGLRQRAMIAMALSCSPTLLIADEPTTALDVTTQTQILELLRQLQQGRDGHHADHARPRRDRRDGDGRGGHVPGPRRRAGAGRRDLPLAPASLHTGAATLHSEDAGALAGAAHPDRGRGAAPV
jgi:peptide/nickel transport system ATP-binding protein